MRKWLTAGLTRVALRSAPHLSSNAIRIMESSVARLGPWVPVLGRIVADNMRSAGIYDRQVYRDYFNRAAWHLAAHLHVLRSMPPPTGHSESVAPRMIDRLAREEILLDGSFELVRKSLAVGRGVILNVFHLCGAALCLARLNNELPLTVYLRKSKDPVQQAAKERWHQRLGLDCISEIPRRSSYAVGGERIIEALRRKRVVIITSDMPQKCERNRWVRFLDREMCMPRGPAILAKLTGAPLLVTSARPQPRGLELIFHGPVYVHDGSNEDDNVPVGSQRMTTPECLQWITDRFADLLREHPSLWFLWGDNRWTRLFGGDPRYLRQLQVDRHRIQSPAGVIQ